MGLASFGLEIWLQSLYQLQSLPSSIGTATESPAKFICESLVIKCFGMPINAHFKHVQVAPCSAFPLGATALSSFSRAVAARYSRAYELHLCTPGSCRGRVGTQNLGGFGDSKLQECSQPPCSHCYSFNQLGMGQFIADKIGWLMLLKLTLQHGNPWVSRQTKITETDLKDRWLFRWNLTQTPPESRHRLRLTPPPPPHPPP